MPKSDVDVSEWIACSPEDIWTYLCDVSCECESQSSIENHDTPDEAVYHTPARRRPGETERHLGRPEAEQLGCKKSIFWKSHSYRL